MPAGILIVCDKTTDVQCDNGAHEGQAISNHVASSALVYTMKNKELAHSHNNHSFTYLLFVEFLILQNKPRKQERTTKKVYIKGKLKKSTGSIFWSTKCTEFLKFPISCPVAWQNRNWMKARLSDSRVKADCHRRDRHQKVRVLEIYHKKWTLIVNLFKTKWSCNTPHWPPLL